MSRRLIEWNRWKEQIVVDIEWKSMGRVDCCFSYDYKRSTSIMFPINNVKYPNAIRQGSHQSHTNVYGS